MAMVGVSPKEIASSQPMDIQEIDKSVSFIIITLLMSPMLGHWPSLWITHKEKASASLIKIL
jgi:hypothetical protein